MVTHSTPAGPAGARAFDAPGLTLDEEPVEAALVVDGAPRVGSRELPAPSGLAAGVWEHTAGTSTDTEVDELFVVISGRATVTVEGGPTLELAPGTVGLLPAGTRTTWTVHEDLRKVWVTPA
jgi:uncharacterized cupin superfamily protein